ncbi:asparagine synthase (glutamine-hydrolysing) [Desulfarculales bacterium]
MVYNDKVYNFQKLWASLEQDHSAIAWRGHSDSEIIPKGFACCDVEACIRRMNRIFAIALWGQRERRLYLVRDRLGKKPLYYGWMAGTFLFGSELKGGSPPTRLAPAEWTTTAWRFLCATTTCPASTAFYEGLHKLGPGAILSLTVGEQDVLPEPKPSWSPRQMAEQGQAQPLTQKPAEAAARLEKLLLNAMKSHTVVDVPLGAFFSGGVNLFLIVALMQA